MTGPVIIRNHPAEQYHADPALSAGHLIAAHQSTWLHAMQGHDDPPTDGPDTASRPMVHGGAWHAWELEPDELARAYFVIPEAPDGLSLNADGSVSRRSKAGKEWWANVETEAAGRRIVDPGMYASIRAMTEAAHGHPVLGPLLRKRTDAELSMWWTDDTSGVRCKARADVVCDVVGVMADLKRTDPHPGAFARAAAKLRYDMRAAWYLDGAAACGIECHRYIYACVEPTAPHAVALYEIAEEDLDLARWRIDKLLEEYAEHQARGEWPGYPTEVQTIQMPPWARIRQEVEDVIDFG